MVERILAKVISIRSIISHVSSGINKAIDGDGLYLHKHDKCYRVQKCKVNGLYLAPHPRFVEGDGLFLKHGNDISDCAHGKEQSV